MKSFIEIMDKNVQYHGEIERLKIKYGLSVLKSESIAIITANIALSSTSLLHAGEPECPKELWK